MAMTSEQQAMRDTTPEGMVWITVSSSIKEFITQNKMSDQGHEAILKDVLNCAQQIREELQDQNPIGVMWLYLKMMDEKFNNSPNNLKSQITCRKGCSACCHMNVDISSYESDLLVHYARTHEIPIDENYLKMQVGLNEKTHMNSSASACVFLKNNECSVYEVRPSMCRKYAAIGPPILCSSENGIQKQAIFFDMEVEVIASAILNVGQMDSMAEQLLISLNPESKNTIHEL